MSEPMLVCVTIGESTDRCLYQKLYVLLQEQPELDLLHETLLKYKRRLDRIMMSTEYPLLMDEVEEELFNDGFVILDCVRLPIETAGEE